MEENNSNARANFSAHAFGCLADQGLRTENRCGIGS
jgi:hypothetical protein